MTQALGAAGVGPDEVHLVNAHGTSSRLGDEVEADALLEVFKGAKSPPLIQSTKGLLGHTLWAAGAIEAVVCLAQMHVGRVHPNANLVKPVREGLSFVGPDALEKELGVVLTNSFGFAGINSAIVLRNGEVPRDG